MSKRAGLTVCMLSMGFGLFGDQGPDLADQLWATTNLWGGAAAMTAGGRGMRPGRQSAGFRACFFGRLRNNPILRRQRVAPP